jgi:hypothetical protein
VVLEYAVNHVIDNCKGPGLVKRWQATAAAQEPKGRLAAKLTERLNGLGAVSFTVDPAESVVEMCKRYRSAERAEQEALRQRVEESSRKQFAQGIAISEHNARVDAELGAARTEINKRLEAVA